MPHLKNFQRAITALFIFGAACFVLSLTTSQARAAEVIIDDLNGGFSIPFKYYRNYMFDPF